MHDHHDAPGPGHNHGPRRAAQWQVPHLPPEHDAATPDLPEPDFDLVEAAFAEGFATASDPTPSELHAPTLQLIHCPPSWSRAAAGCG